MNIEVRFDQQRGCGWRKAGGMYLISGGVSAGCARIPLPLHVCPTCNAGIKPTRGFTWIDTNALLLSQFADRLSAGRVYECSLAHCSACPMGGAAGKHGLIWIGGSFYKRPEDWTREAVAQGVSRRISQVPKELKIGETWILVAHREAILKREAIILDGQTQDAEYEPAIFHAFKPTAIEYVVKGDETEEELERLVKRGITPVRVERVGEQQELGTEEDMTEAEEVTVG